MIALPSPIPATYLGIPSLVIAMDEGHVYLVDADGKIAKATFDIVEIDWKYDYESQVWVDYGPIPEGGYAEPEEETDDGGEEIQGRVPDPDGAGGGNQGDQENGETWGLDSREES